MCRPSLRIGPLLGNLVTVATVVAICVGWTTAGPGAGAHSLDTAQEAPQGDPPDPSAYYGEGLELLRAGDTGPALDSWEDAWDELAARGLHDPRIGIAYVEAVVEAGDSTRSSTASEIFLWGLGAPLVEGGREALIEELERVLVLVEDEESEWMESLADSSDSSLALALKRFWIERDPTPSSDLNERLIEHWERITYARRHFVYSRRPPFGTDARGPVYVRFGEAPRIQRGSLGASEVELQIRVPRDREGRMRIRQYDPNPQYEVWVYDALNPQGFTYFLFGNVDGTGPFELVDGVHELVSPAARSQASARFTPGHIPASHYLELFYYRDLSMLGGPFGRRFAELDRLWNSYTYRSNAYVSASRLAPSESEIESLTFRYRQEDEFFPPNQPERPVLSAYEGRERDELVAQAVRLLSDDDVPLLAILGASAPRLGADRLSAYTGEFALPEWVMRHTLIIRDQLLDEVGRLVQPVGRGRADLSAFVIRHVPEPLHLTLTARTLLTAEGSDTLVHGERLPGQAHIVPPPPLDPDPELFQASDLLTGTPIPPEIDADALPYPILPARRLWIRDPLRVYLETYHMGTGPEGRAVLDARFTVLPLEDDGTVAEKREAITLEVHLNPLPNQAYREAFDMQLRDQEPGRYRLEVEVVDRVKNQRQFRTAELTLVR